MGFFDTEIAGSLPRSALPSNFLARLAERARSGRFGAGGVAYTTEEIAEGGGGYRDVPQITGLKLVAKGSTPLSELTVRVDPSGDVSWKAAMTSWKAAIVQEVRGRLLLVLTLLGITALTVRHAHVTPLLALVPLVGIALFSLVSSRGRAAKSTRKAVEAALRDEIDEALTASDENERLAREVVATAERAGLTLTEDERTRILECDDANALQDWLQNARFAKIATEIFDGPRVRFAEPQPEPAPESLSESESEPESASVRKRA